MGKGVRRSGSSISVQVSSVNPQIELQSDWVKASCDIGPAVSV